MNSTPTKCRFLRSLGAVARVGAVYRTMETLGLTDIGAVHATIPAPDLPAGSGNGKRIVLLGVPGSRA